MYSHTSNLNFSTGPVGMAERVKKIFQKEGISHRSEAFQTLLAQTQKTLCQATNARFVHILTGSGTLANEVMLSQLKISNEKGLVLNNGEFGLRLIKQCERQNIPIEQYSIGIGEAFDLGAIEQLLQQDPSIKWLLFVHCETSVGFFNPMNELCLLAKKYGVRANVDLMSSFACCETDLSLVTMATASSGKGLASVAGLAILFSNQALQSSPNLPSYLDLGFYFDKKGVPFTLSPHLLEAIFLQSKYVMQPRHWQKTKQHGDYLLDAFKKMPHIELVHYLPTHVFTLFIKDQLHVSGSSAALGEYLQKEGIETSFQSDGLRSFNHLQIALMGEHTREEVAFLVEKINAYQYQLQPLEALEEAYS
jgi:aspartate aminotransferase-like enzyme